MMARTEDFYKELDRWLTGGHVPTPSSDAALRAAAILLALDLESEITPPRELRARWISGRTFQTIPGRTTFTQTLRTRPLMATLIVLLILLLLSGVAYALGKALGYVPGYGLMEQNVQMLALDKPVTQTRGGVTITIEDMAFTADKLYSTITIENIPANLSLPMTDTTTVTCQGDWTYQLPDGSKLGFEHGGRGTMEPLDENDPSLFRFRLRGYAMLSSPMDMSRPIDIKLRIPCVTSDIPAGSLPENWDFHLHFVPAPAGRIKMTVFPVTEYPKTPQSP